MVKRRGARMVNISPDTDMWRGTAGAAGAWFVGRAKGAARRLIARAVRAGASPSLFGYRHVEEADLRGHAAAAAATGAPARYETVHPAVRACNPAPANAALLPPLPSDRGWWGYSMRDVPRRESGETFIATIPDALVVAYVDEKQRYFPAILSRDGAAVNLREIRFRPGHAETLRCARAAGETPRRLARATWITERVYDNHSHWLTAHLPKLKLLSGRGALGDVALPRELTPAMEESIRMLGLDPDAFLRVDRLETLSVGALTILGTDRFRPELLRPVRDAMAPPLPPAQRRRRVYISRAGARIRRLLNEDEIWPQLEAAGFERVRMEALDFREQVRLMRETAVLAAPHGAGLTNMMFCAEGADIVEIADLGFPNPNFYALAAAMGHRHHIVPAEAVGDRRPLDQDLRADPAFLDRTLAMVRGLHPSAAGAA